MRAAVVRMHSLSSESKDPVANSTTVDVHCQLKLPIQPSIPRESRDEAG